VREVSGNSGNILIGLVGRSEGQSTGKEANAWVCQLLFFQKVRTLDSKTTSDSILVQRNPRGAEKFPNGVLMMPLVLSTSPGD